MSCHPFRDLTTVVDGVHALIDGWAETGALAPALDADGIEVLRLAVHEWIANLVQHAAFPQGVEIVVEVEADGESVYCAVEDSSAGFDFAGQVERQQAILDAPAPSERGRGLLMLITCTESLAFQPAAPGHRQCVSFRVRSATVAPLFETLFRPEDLVGDPFDGDPFDGDSFDATAFDAVAFDGEPFDADAFHDDAFSGAPGVPGGPASASPGGDSADGHASLTPFPSADAPGADGLAPPPPSR